MWLLAQPLPILQSYSSCTIVRGCYVFFAKTGEVTDAALSLTAGVLRALQATTYSCVPSPIGLAVSRRTLNVRVRRSSLG